MNELSEKLREKYRAEGYREGVIAERLQTINLLRVIADSDDVDYALSVESDKLMSIQARELSSGAQGNAGSQVSHARQLAAGITAANGGVASKDLQDTVAELMLAERRETL